MDQRLLLVPFTLWCCYTCVDGTKPLRPQDPVTSKPSTQARPELRLDTFRDTYQLGEPVMLLVVLTNRSDKEAHLSPLTAPFLTIELKEPGSADWTKLRRKDRRVRAVRLGPGKSITATEFLHLQPGNWWLRRPGPYQVRARYVDRPYDKKQTWLAKASLQKDVVLATPRTKAGREIASKMMSESLVNFLESPSRRNYTRAAKTVEAVLDQAPKSPSAAYLLYRKAEYLSTGYFDPEQKAFKSDKKEAVRLLRSVVSHTNDTLLAAEASLVLHSTLSDLAQPKEAGRVVDALFERHPNAKTIPGLKDKLSGDSHK